VSSVLSYRRAVRGLGVMVGVLAIAAPLRARAENAASWEAFVEERRLECDGPPGTLAKPIELEAGGHRYRLEGHRLVQTDKDADTLLRIGVISAVKDDREETIGAVKTLVERFKKSGMDVLIANGDLATNALEMENVFPLLASAGVLVVAHIGNTESCSSFNQAAVKTFETNKAFINGNWIRRIDLDDATLLTMPGYYNRAFVHTSGGAHYKQEDVDALRQMAEGAPAPLVFVSHGPPKMDGKKAIDLATDGGNVGDTMTAELIKKLGITFGISGHILEAGGRGTDATGKSSLPPEKWHPSLFLNAGTANPDPWGMHDGKTSYGMGLYVEIDQKKARYRVERLPQPPPPAD
jgi:Icc-related predicted phosphoesterase